MYGLIMKQKDTLLSRFTQSITTLFFTGIIVLLPITLTVALLSFSFRILIKWLEPLKKLTDFSIVSGIFPHPEIVLAIVIILVAGIIYNVFLIRTVIHALENLVIQIPIIRPVYSGFKQLVRAFSLQDKLTFKQVVIVEFPRKDILSIGFLTSEFDRGLLTKKGSIAEKKFYNVFIPTTPNPTTGFFIIVPEEQLISTNVTRQEAMAMIISGGIIQPEPKENGQE